MRLVRHLLFASFYLVLCAAGASAQVDGSPRVAPAPGRIAAMPHVGTDITVGGVFTQSASARFNITDTFAGIAFDNPGTFNFGSLKFNDAYGNPLDVGLGVAYGVSDRGEVFGSFRYLNAAGQKIRIASMPTTGGVSGIGYAAGDGLLAKFSNFSAASLEAGYRHFFPAGGSLLPYVSGMVGVSRTNPIDTQLFVASAANGELTAGKVRLYDKSTSASAGFNMGVTHVIAPQASIGLEVGLRYDGLLEDNDTDIGRFGDGGLSALNNAGSRWSAPLRLMGRIAF